MVVASVVLVKVILGIKTPLLLATMSNCEDGLGVDIPIPTCACMVMKQRNNKLKESIILFISIRI